DGMEEGGVRGCSPRRRGSRSPSGGTNAGSGPGFAVLSCGRERLLGALKSCRGSSFADGLDKRFLTYDEIAALEDVELTKERTEAKGWFLPPELESAACCKRSASVGLPQRCHRVPPKCNRRGRIWLPACVLGVIRRNTYTESRRLITRRSQVQILPPLLRKAPETAPFAH